MGERSGETCPLKKNMASDGTATVKVRTMGSERRGGVVNVWGYGMKTLVFSLSYNAVCFMHHSTRCFYNTNRGKNGRDSY